MPLYDRHVIVDWSAANTPKRGRDSIWLCAMEIAKGQVSETALENISTRDQAMTRLYEMIDEALAADKRLCIGLDFAFGYPRGGAKRMTGQGRWDKVWNHLAAQVEDDDTNKSNRFDLAARLNRETFDDLQGPFWGLPNGHNGRYPGLGPKRPSYDALPEKRLVEQRVPRAQPVWKLAYTGSVGSQTLLGIARLAALRARYGSKVAVWPFETDFAEKLEAPVLITEVYPSLMAARAESGLPKDAIQVRTLCSRFAGLDSRDGFAEHLACPSSLSDDDRKIVLAEEGWIVGASTGLADPDKAGIVPAMRQSANRPQPVHVAQRSMDYVSGPAAIYRASFEEVQQDERLAKLSGNMRTVATRLIHSCGIPDIVEDLDWSKGAAAAGKVALQRGANVYCDVEMVRNAIIAKNLPSLNPLVCTLNDTGVEEHARTISNTRSAAAVDFWGEDLHGGVVAIGNAPTALFRLLERLKETGEKPILIIGIPVGFVGAAESKQALAESGHPFITVHGKRGGSAMAGAVVNALAGGLN
ncbi:precorrin-8X methylmutase [Ahrensia sp. R2A130]|uniref:precorrin-8X methylmutase n=1 Tax=Ahrensia sp. R2A130 TaxID=744979 RepID=UPI0001E0AC68|nr:precorrin-8X methylmutase [Ahrensia sp. R2A130]EFL90685.1 precorrin-8X methylmutase [Ahrensia sp. R2A130]